MFLQRFSGYWDKEARENAPAEPDGSSLIPHSCFRARRGKSFARRFVEPRESELAELPARAERSFEGRAQFGAQISLRVEIKQ